KIEFTPIFEGANGLAVAGCPAGWFAFRSTDAGVTWKAGARIDRTYDSGNFSFADVRRGMFFDEASSSTVVTTDGGETWSQADLQKDIAANVEWSQTWMFATVNGQDGLTNIMRADYGRAWRAVASVRGSAEFAFSDRTVLAIVS